MMLDRGRHTQCARLLQALLVAACLLSVSAPLRATDTPVKPDAPKVAATRPQAKPAPKAAPRHYKPASKAVVKAQPLPAQEQPPLPAWLMNEPAVKPSVTLADGMLTIDAPNSTLSDVLSGVQKAMGATLDGPTPTERVAIHLGPGQPDQVLTALLEGTPYDYIILGDSGHPEAISRIVLNPAGREAKESMGTPAATKPEPTRNLPAIKRAEETPKEETEEEAEPEEIPPHDVKPLNLEVTPTAQKEGIMPPDAPKSVEQIYQELRNQSRPQPQ